jgi:hypothetical protein
MLQPGEGHAPPEKTSQVPPKKQTPEKLRPVFNRAAKTLTPVFNRAAKTLTTTFNRASQPGISPDFNQVARKKR